MSKISLNERIALKLSNDKRMLFVVYLAAAVIPITMSSVGFYVGQYHSRQQIRNLVDNMANSKDDQGNVGTNSFTKCLIEAWEESGELEIGGRKWVLSDGR